MVFVLLLLLFLGGAAGPIAEAGSFSRGRVHTSLLAGQGSAYGDQYFILGVGAGYYILDGLQVGLDAEGWFGGDPSVYRISPEVQYVFELAGVWKPYLGGYFRHTLVQGSDGFSSVGGRTGVLMDAGGNMSLGAGMVYDTMLDCDSEFTSSCSQVYPEFRLSVSF